MIVLLQFDALPSMGPASGAEKFCLSARKDFFDSIDPTRTSAASGGGHTATGRH